MLPVHLRLKRSQDFERVRAQGKVWRDQHLKVNIAHNDLPHSRFGFIVSRRVGDAVTRNQLKRRLRAAVSGYLPGILTGYDVVIITYPSTADLTYQELEASLGKLLKLACLVRPEMDA